MAQSLRMTAMRWEGWGDPARAISLPPQLRALLENALGVRPTGRPTGSLQAIELPPPAFDASGLRTIVGEPHVRTGSADRIRHTRGKSTVDILRIRAGSVEDAPDAVVLPAGHEEVLDVLRWCAQRRVDALLHVGGIPGGIFGDLSVGFGGSGGLIDSYDSRVGPYNAASPGSHGDVGSNGGIDLASADIDHGNATAGGTVTCSSSCATQVTGTLTNGAPPVALVPNPYPTCSPLTDGTGISGGTYYGATGKKAGQLVGIESVNRASDHVFGRRILGMNSSIAPEQAQDLSFDLKAALA